jgi:acyl-CoA reductase-like NAD-dependent aldehyde dehydrogenase
MVHMTGGTAVAKDVVQQTSQRLARTALELGGKSPAIITDDVDVDEVPATLVPGRYRRLWAGVRRIVVNPCLPQSLR